MLKVFPVRTVTKGLVSRAAAAAKRNDRSALKAVYISIFVDNLKIAFYFNRPVAIDDKFCRCHKLEFPAKVTILRKGLPINCVPGTVKKVSGLFGAFITFIN